MSQLKHVSDGQADGQTVKWTEFAFVSIGDFICKVSTKN